MTAQQIREYHCWLNYCRAQYRRARKDLSAANANKYPRGEIMRRLNHYRHQVLDTVMDLRIGLLARGIQQ